MEGERWGGCGDGEGLIWKMGGLGITRDCTKMERRRGGDGGIAGCVKYANHGRRQEEDSGNLESDE